ncbi:quinone oxidoreductase family protein [Fodinicola acaciae]|uniref:quinone oxidoreductase family protein n=1 Tax=Fodinicola acaciae TaxID=2681555 RepID=UPI0013D5A8F7|nr:zinc-binding dehydrogenase [Fodinicola acaciae]
MKGVVFREPGGPEVLRVEDVPKPVPADGQLLVRTEAIGMSYYETMLRSGGFPFPVPLPVVFGFEAAGIADGRRVVAFDMTGGAYAEFMVTSADKVTDVPDGLSAADAVAVAGQASTAAVVLEHAKLTGGETILIESAAGPVGGYLAQLARRAGVARIIGTAGGPAKIEHALKVGFDEVVDHNVEGWQSRLSGIDVVFECIGGESAKKTLSVLKSDTGRMVGYGLISGSFPDIDENDPRYSRASMDNLPAREMLELAANGDLTPLIDSVMPLEKAADAHRRYENRLATGKIVLVP